MAKMSDDELVALCETEMTNCVGYAEDSGEVATQRAQALDYYHGNMDAYIDHEEGRSAYVSRDVMDTVELALPSIMKIFLDAENAVEFRPNGPNDVQAAQQETQAVRHVFYEQNEGFLLLYTFLKDALLSKIGIIKTWFEEGEIERGEYEGLTDPELSNLLDDPEFNIEVIHHTPYRAPLPDGSTQQLHDIAIAKQTVPGQIKCVNIPPEEFGVTSTCRSPRVNEATFVFQRVRKTRSELIEAGFDRKKVEKLSFDQDGNVPFNEEQLARYDLTETQMANVSSHVSMQTIWVTECYPLVDLNDDGIAERWKITLAGRNPGATLLDKEEVDSVTFATGTPIINTHRADGKSLADAVLDLQELYTTLIRGILDNTYLANNPRLGINELVNVDDALISRSGGVIRVEGTQPPAHSMSPVVHPPIPPSTFGLLEMLDEVKKMRTGVGDDVMGLDADALANVNTGVMIQAYEMARMRIELMARILAECGVKDVFLNIHELICKNPTVRLQFPVKGEWVNVDPKEWKTRKNIKIGVGTGHHNRQRRLMSIKDIQQTQQAMGPELVRPNNIYETAVETARAHGLEPERFFTDPVKHPMPKGPPPPEVIKAQADMERVQIEKQKLGMEQQRMQFDIRKAEMDLMRMQMDSQLKRELAEAKLQEAQMKIAMEGMKGKIALHKQMVDEQSQLINAQTTRESTQSQAAIAIDKQKWQQTLDAWEQKLDQYKAELSAATQLKTTLIQAQAKQDEEIRRLQEQLQQMRTNVERSSDKPST